MESLLLGKTKTVSEVHHMKHFFFSIMINTINFLGGFSESESFVGKISFLDFWDRKLNAIEINEYYRTCDPYQGSLYSWTDLKFKTVGSIKIKQSEFCKPCDKNLTIANADIVSNTRTSHDNQMTIL